MCASVVVVECLCCPNFLSLPCVITDCPDGVHFRGKVAGSLWEAEPAESGGKQWRIARCPPGYELHRDPSLPETDDCVKCSQGFYRLKPAFWQGPNVSLPTCYTCPKGSICPGGDIVKAQDGHWQLRTQSSGGYEYLDSASDVCQAEGAQEGTVCLFPAGLYVLRSWTDSPMRCTLLPQVSTAYVCARDLSISDRRLESSNTTTDACSAENGVTCGSARVYPCDEGACSEDNTCLQNRTGPLCGSCSPGFSMTTAGCSAASCPSEEELRPSRALAFSLGALMFLTLWFVLSWRPVVPEAEFVLARLAQSIGFLVAWCVCFKDAQGVGAKSASDCSNFTEQILEYFVWLDKKIQSAFTWWDENKVGQFLKIYFTCLQILSSFSMFTVQWPTTFLVCINWVRGTVKFDFIKLPVLSCLWHGVSWKSTLYTYTLTPVGMIVVLGMPILAAFWRGLHLTAITRWNDTLDRFYRNLIVLLFLLYPILTMQAMSSLNCEPNLGRLRDDLRIICPDFLSFDSIYSCVFIVLYAIGIPVFNHLCLRYMGIVNVVKEKMQRAEFHAMLSLFMKIYVSIEEQRFARLVGNVDGNTKEFKRQCKDQYDMLIKLQGGGSTGINDDDGIDLKKLEKAAEGAVSTSQGMQGTSLKGIIKCLKEFDEYGNGIISEEEFEKMMSTVRKKANLFTGTENDPNTLNLEQLQTLVLFDRWPSRHKGPQDVVEGEGLGGANATLFEREKKATAGDSELDDAERAEEIAEERAERQRKVDAGDIQDPMLRKIHELEQELQKRMKAGREINKKIEDMRMQPIQELHGHEIKILQQQIPISGEYLSSHNTLSEVITGAKKVYIENPDEVDACLKRIKGKAIPEDELRRTVYELAHRLVADEIIAYPAQVWSNQRDGEEDDRKGKDPSPEQILISRFGFLFVAYRVDCWWFEGVEMLRKLLMTSVLVFIRPGTPGQLSAGAMITFFFLLLGLFWRPFCSSILNSLNNGTLIAQFLTLFVGIMIVLLDAMPAGTSQSGGDDRLDRAIMSFMVVAVNGVALAWPFVHKTLSGQLDDYYEMVMEVYVWFCSKYARWCGSKEQRDQIAAADAKTKKKKQKEKQRAKEAEAAAKASRVNAGSQTQATSHSESDAELGIVNVRRIPEITSARHATSTQTAPASASLPSLPPALETVKDHTGNQYCYNKELNVTQWKHPAPSEGAVVFTPVSSHPTQIDHQVQSMTLRSRRSVVVIPSERQILEITTVGQATSTETAPALTSLPLGWEVAKDQTGNQYYYNKELNVTQWRHPAPSEGAVVFTPVSSLPSHIDHQVQSKDLRSRRAPPVLMRTPPVLMTNTPHSETVAVEQVVPCERQILEITAVGQATFTQAAPVSTSLPPGEAHYSVGWG